MGQVPAHRRRCLAGKGSRSWRSIAESMRSRSNTQKRASRRFWPWSQRPWSLLSAGPYRMKEADHLDLLVRRLFASQDHGRNKLSDADVFSLTFPRALAHCAKSKSAPRRTGPTATFVEGQRPSKAALDLEVNPPDRTQQQETSSTAKSFARSLRCLPRSRANARVRRDA